MLNPENFPQAASEGVQETSIATPVYNCIAWAAGDDRRHWWPNQAPASYWPPEIPNRNTVYAFLKLFTSLGYQKCDSSDLEPGFLKVAIYSKDNKVTHAARQLPNGAWTSKIGQNIDIEHQTLQAVEGPLYGTATRYLKRSFQNEHNA